MVTYGMLIFFFFSFFTPQSNIVKNCEDNAILYNEFDLKKSSIECDKNIKVSNAPLYKLYFSEKNIIMYGEKNYITINLEEKSLVKDSMEDIGIIQSISTYEGEKIITTNINMSEEGYESYLFYKDLKISSQGGLILSGNIFNNHIYTIERKVPGIERILYKYNMEGDLISEFNGAYSSNGLIEYEDKLLYSAGNELFQINADDSISSIKIDFNLSIDDNIIIPYEDKLIIISKSSGEIIILKEDFSFEKHYDFEISKISDDKDATNIDNCYISNQVLECRVQVVVNQRNIAKFMTFNLESKSISYSHEFNFETEENRYPMLKINWIEN